VATLLGMKGLKADYYHAGLSSDERTLKQESWIKNQTRVMVCTNAFGMGIDKPDVRVVVHYDVPDCLENYYQEAGRAGRDGERAYAVMLYQPSELSDLLQMAQIRYPSANQIKKIYTALMNYLQVAAGGGEGNSYDFDMAVFAQRFKLNILETTYGIQALAQQEILSFNEIFFRPSTVFFSTTKKDLADFVSVHPELDDMIKALLRSYEGIFDYPTTIYEGLLAKFLSVAKEDVIAKLRRLHQFGIIQYTPPVDKPQVYLIQSRMYSDDFKIDAKQIALRKAEHEKRIMAITGYVQSANSCRSVMLADYFGATIGKNCKICDNCINQAQVELNPEQFKQLSDQILLHTKNDLVEINQLMKLLHHKNESQVWQAIQFLLSEELLSQEPSGCIKARN
jgi:ATP-dependent DNA helicase RecQ